MRATIKFKLAIAFGVILLLSGGAEWFAITKLAEIKDGMAGLLTGPAARLEGVKDLEIAIINHLRKQKNILLTSKPEEIKSIEAAIVKSRADIAARFDRVGNSISGTHHDAFNTLRTLYGRYEEIEKKIVELAQRNTNAEAYELASTEGQKLLSRRFDAHPAARARDHGEANA